MALGGCSVVGSGESQQRGRLAAVTRTPRAVRRAGPSRLTWGGPRASAYRRHPLPRLQVPDPGVRACRVLVIDDEETIRDVVADALQLEGYPVAIASNGLEALRIIDQEEPTLVLLDMRMPVLDGWGFNREFRQRGYDVPIVVITAAQNAKRWAEEIGAAGYLSKPFDLDDLLRIVERFCGGA